MTASGGAPLPPRLRPRWMYRAAFMWAGVGLVYLLASGRLLAYVAAFRAPLSQSQSQLNDMFTTALLWLASIVPLLVLGYDLGSQHTEARRFGTTSWRGLVETWRVAWGRPRLAEMAENFAEPPADDAADAVLYGLAVAAAPLVLFLSFMPTLRTVRGVIWVGGASILFGVMAYCHRRAAAYLREDPGAWNMFRQWSLLNVDRYEPAGRRFVRAQIVCTILLPIWWLGGGAIFIM